jgi:enoyl-CoA hydratase/carnithine racemase
MSIAKYASQLSEYSERYADFLKFKREDGILEARFHTNDGPLQWGLETHHGIIPAMFDINADPENEVMILTGTGDSFLSEFNTKEWVEYGFTQEFTAHHGYDLFYKDQTREPLALINLQIPVIAALNGPAIVHSELALLNDIVIASENTYFYEGHYDGAGVVPGDGVHTLFRELLGPNRGRYFLLMGNKIDAEEALRLGLIGEVLPQDKLLDRAWQIAREKFMTKDRIHRRMTRSLLMQPWRELFTKELFSGMAHESFACMHHWPMSSNSVETSTAVLDQIRDRAKE